MKITAALSFVLLSRLWREYLTTMLRAMPVSLPAWVPRLTGNLQMK